MSHASRAAGDGPAAMIACRLLGPVELSAGGGPVPPELLWRKHLALLVYLTSAPRCARTRDHLIGLLWGDKSDSAARHSLREAVRILRQALGPEAVETSGQQIRIVEGTVALDTDAFAALTTAGRWTAAADLVGGEFLEGFGVPDASPFEDWLTSRRAEWRALAGDALRQAAEARLVEGRTAEATAAARRALELQPLSDVAVQTLMRCAALHGDRGAALEAFDDFAHRLRRETGGVPDGATAALAQRIRRARGPSAPATRVPGERAWTRRAPLVGRTEALSRLMDLWDCAAQGRGAAVAILEGDLGLGRTRLIEELIGRVGLAGGSVASTLAVRTDREEEGSGLTGFARGGLGDAPGAAAATPAALSAFAFRIPAWADKYPGARRTGLALGPAFREIVAAAAEEQPVLLAVDDAHWLDDESFAALQSTLRDLARARLMLVLSSLPGMRRLALDELRAELSGRPGAVISLAPLAPEDVAALAAWALPGYDPDALRRVSRRVLADSAGIPLLAVELLHAITLGLGLAHESATWPAPLRTLSQTLPGDLPQAVVGAIRMGFRALSPLAQTVLAALSVLPDRASEDLALRATEVDAHELREALDELEWQRWIITDPRGCTFVARIMKDVVARDMLTPGQARRIRDRTP